MAARKTRGEAIRAFCVECMGGNRILPGQCEVVKCHLWRYRTGREQKSPPKG